MRAIELAFTILVFMCCLSIVTNSGLFPYGRIYYESEYMERYTNLPENISTVSETQQYSTTMNIVDIIFGSLSFGWILAMVPQDFRDEVLPIVAILDVFASFIMAVALIEIFAKRRLF